MARRPMTGMSEAGGTGLALMERRTSSKAERSSFFEKKKQKTFAPSRRHLTSMTSACADPNEQKFFGSFFQKKNTAFFQ
jgi:hypothetical protein